MYDWIFEGDLGRCRRTLREIRDHVLREQIKRFVTLTERRLIEAGRAVTRAALPSIGWLERDPGIF